MSVLKGKSIGKDMKTFPPRALENHQHSIPSSINQETLDICNSIKEGISKEHVTAAERKLNKVSSNNLKVGQEYYIYDDTGSARNYYKYSKYAGPAMIN